MARIHEIGKGLISPNHLGRKLATAGVIFFAVGLAGDFYLDSKVDDEVKGQIPDTVALVDQEKTVQIMKKWGRDVSSLVLNMRGDSYTEVLRISLVPEVQSASFVMDKMQRIESLRQPLIEAKKTEWGYGQEFRNGPFDYTGLMQGLGLLTFCAGVISALRPRISRFVSNPVS